MSIQDEIKRRCSDDQLSEIAPFHGDPQRRFLYVAPEIKRFAEGPWYDSAERLRGVRLQADFAVFLSDELVRVARRARHAKRFALFVQLQDVEEVWELRSVEPQPSLRLFGRFAAKDVFIALCWQYRAALGMPDSREWDFKVRQCQHIWRELFFSYKPHTGSYPHDYISGADFD